MLVSTNREWGNEVQDETCLHDKCTRERKVTLSQCPIFLCTPKSVLSRWGYEKIENDSKMTTVDLTQ